MKQRNRKADQILKLLTLLASLALCGGCAVFSPPDPNPQDSYAFPEGKNAATAETEGFHLRAGELLTITFSDLPPPGIPQQTFRVRDDGKITLPYNVTVSAAGKTAGQVEEEIRNAYVPRVFQQITVSIRPEERYYFVGGQVRQPGRYQYLGKVTVLRAIDTAQGFTDFANKKRIELRRANGEIRSLDHNKAIKDMRRDLMVYPDDQIFVHRKYF